MGRQGLSAVITACFASACATTATPVQGPDGQEHQLIKCESSEDCYEKADEVCRGPYQLVTSGDRSTPSALYPGWHEMLVKCGDPSASKSAATTEDTPKVAPRNEADVPKAAAGFSFGDSVEVAQASCTNASFEWTEEHKAYRCSGTPVDTGMPAHARLTFCDSELCKIDLLVEAAGGALADDIERIARTLSKRYGNPNQRDVLYSQSCTGAALPDCIAQNVAHFWYEWRWSGGHTITLSLGSRRPAPQGAAASPPATASIRLHYDDGRAVKTSRATGAATGQAPRTGDVEGL